MSTEITTRQQARHITWATAWKRWRVEYDERGNITSAPCDEHGLMLRRVRRSIASALARKVWREIDRGQQQ